MKRNRFLAFITVLFAATLFARQNLSAQGLLEQYLSQDELAYATDIATDSIGSEAVLVGIAAPGEVDLSELFPGLVAPGFEKNNGTSSAWGYLYMTPSRNDSIGVAVLRVALGGKQAFAEREGDYDQEPVALDLTGAYSGSDAFATRLRANAVFNKYHSDYPGEIPDAAVLAWRPLGAAEILSPSFPADKPIWGIYYPGNDDDIPAMACFVATGTGQDTCVVIDFSSSIDADAITSAGITVQPNPASADNDIRIRISAADGRKPEQVSLYDVAGRELRDLSGMLQTDGRGEYVITLSLSGLTSGRYYCRVVSGESIRSIPVIVE